MEEILKYLNKLKNKKLNDIGRVADMAWVHFGDIVHRKNYKGNDREYGECALHFQCPWRIIKNNEIIVGSYDMYIPKTGEWIEDFNWDIQGENLFDKKIIEIKKDIINSPVQKIDFYEFGDLKLLLENGYQIETFINCSHKEESWRFMDNTENKHIVCFEED